MNKAKLRTKAKPNAKPKAKESKRGKWSRHPWIRILEILAAMPAPERNRCIRATNEFFEGRP